MEESRSPFRRIRTKGTPPADPESLFKELRTRSPEIRDLFSHQADILRSYAKDHLESPDVSLELPTGSGKTLVGLLIAEFRRRIRRERALYLCPTRQLAYQVGAQARTYGIETKVLVGPKKEYPIEDVTNYRAGRAIAVSTYGGFFNVSPGLYDPQTIILDDAHDAEAHIAKMWSVSIARRERHELYFQVLSLFEKHLPQPFVASFYQEPRPKRVPQPWMLPFGTLTPRIAALRSLLDSATPSPDDPELYFPWTTVREGLTACSVYFSWDEILIRPFIPPTLTHAPFARALQRVYMSATIGSGGELERSAGIPAIQRIPTPKAYASHGVGRRLFVFPDLFQPETLYEPWLLGRLSRQGTPRTLVLAPTVFSAEAFRNRARDAGPETMTFLEASDIESSLAPFTESKRATLVLTGRYDGIDLPHEDCRQIIMYGLPSGTNLQEAFLERTLGLEVLLRERTRTRISQGTGRCTRSDTDYAVVLMVGRSLLDYCVRTENQLAFHPELRAEIQFALDQRPKSYEDLDGMIDAFLSRDKRWTVAEQDIQSLRSDEAPPESVTTSLLSSCVKDEVDHAYALWSGNHSKAVRHARAVVDGLSGAALSSYRAFWSYNVAAAANLAAQVSPEFVAVCREFLGRSAEACRTVSWFAYAVEAVGEPTIRPKADDLLLGVAADGLVDLIGELGTVGPSFQAELAETRRLLRSTNSTEFDTGVVRLGRVLGFESWKPEGAGTPDAVWKMGARFAIVFEGKAGETPDGPVSVRDCTQTAGHLNWAASEPRLRDAEDRFAVLVSPRTRIEREAIPHASQVYSWTPSEALNLLDRARAFLESVRARMVEGRDEDRRALIVRSLTDAALDPTSVRRIILARTADSLPRR